MKLHVHSYPDGWLNPVFLPSKVLVAYAQLTKKRA